MNPKRFQRMRAVLARRQPDLTVLMDRVHKSHNFSAIIRSCDAAGVLEAHVVPPEVGLDIHHGPTAGTHKWVDVRHHESTEAAIAHLERRDFEVIAAHPSPESIDFREIDFTRPVAIVMGTELHGVSDATLELAHRRLSVPMVGMVRSLNVSVAAALILFEAARQRDRAGLYDRCRLDPARFERTLFEWAYPSVAHRRRQEGRDYPALTETGEIVPDW